MRRSREGASLSSNGRACPPKRGINAARPDYRDYLQWLNIPEHEDDPMTIFVVKDKKLLILWKFFLVQKKVTMEFIIFIFLCVD
jgi:hypothetical protein